MSKETILSVLLASAVVLGSIAIFSKSIKPLPSETDGKIIENSSKQGRTYTPSEQSIKTVPKTGVIKKCILGGKVVYSDIECAPGAKSTAIKIEDSKGIVSPDRETVDATMQRMLAENKRNREQTGTPVMSLEVKKKISPLCENYKTQIEHLDAQARRGNSSAGTDILRKARWDIQKLQLDGNCYAE